MTSHSNLLLDYFGGRLTVEQLQAQIAGNPDRSSQEVLRLAQLDQRFRRILSGLKPRPGAAQRLGELVSMPQVPERSGKTPWLRSLLPGGASLEFDVVGAQHTPKKSEKKPVHKKQDSAKRRSRLPKRKDSD